MVFRLCMYARESRCWMTGVPTYVLNPAQPTFILQEPKKDHHDVAMIAVPLS